MGSMPQPGFLAPMLKSKSASRWHGDRRTPERSELLRIQGGADGFTQIVGTLGPLKIESLVARYMRTRQADAFSDAKEGAYAVSPAVRMLAAGVGAILGMNFSSGRYPREVPWGLQKRVRKQRPGSRTAAPYGRAALRRRGAGGRRGRGGLARGPGGSGAAAGLGRCLTTPWGAAC
jgi:hypothetical protein